MEWENVAAIFVLGISAVALVFVLGQCVDKQSQHRLECMAAGHPALECQELLKP